MFGPDGPDASTFRRQYWRQQPLLVKGGNRHFVGEPVDIARFDRMTLDLRRLAPQDVKDSGDGVIFLQNVDRVDPALAAIAQRLAQQHGWHRPWFDSVKTNAGSAGGIGCHYDDSDNFVLQQAGTKVWRVCQPPAGMEDEHRQRVLGFPGVGNAIMEECCKVFTLEPGDVLYIPLFWHHWGQSVGDSLSISLVCNSTHMLRELLPKLVHHLSTHPAWWRPLHCAAPPDERLDTGERSGLAGDLLALNAGDASPISIWGGDFDRAWATLQDPALIATLRTEWLAHMKALNSCVALSPPSERPSDARLASRNTTFFAPQPAPADALLHGLRSGQAAHAAVAQAAKLRAEWSVQRLTVQLGWLFRVLPVNDPRLPALYAVQCALADLSEAGRQPFGHLPAWVLWIERVDQAQRFGHSARIDLLLQHLWGLLIPDLLAAGAELRLEAPWPITALTRGLLLPTPAPKRAVADKDLWRGAGLEQTTLVADFGDTGHGRLLLKAGGTAQLVLHRMPNQWLVETGALEDVSPLAEEYSIWPVPEHRFFDTFLPLTFTERVDANGSVEGSNKIVEATSVQRMAVRAASLLQHIWPSLAAVLHAHPRWLLTHPHVLPPNTPPSTYAVVGDLVMAIDANTPVEYSLDHLVGQLAHERMRLLLDAQAVTPSSVQANDSLLLAFVYAVRCQLRHRLGEHYLDEPLSALTKDMPPAWTEAIMATARGDIDPFS